MAKAGRRPVGWADGVGSGQTPSNGPTRGADGSADVGGVETGAAEQCGPWHGGDAGRGSSAWAAEGTIVTWSPHPAHAADGHRHAAAASSNAARHLRASWWRERVIGVRGISTSQ